MPTASPQKTLIHVQDVHKAFNGNPVLRGVSLEVHPKEVVAVIGTSGCGKSTLLKIIAGLEEPDRGTVHLEDPNFTMVFQYSALFDSLSVYENVGFSLLEPPDAEESHLDVIDGHLATDTQGVPRAFPRRGTLAEADIRRIVTEKLKMVGLEGIEDKYPNELSGGMRKRVSFARAIVSNPKIILYDEPTAGLDPIASASLEDYILKLRDELEAASIVVTHTLTTILRTADRVCLLHEGRIRWMGDPQAFLASDDPMVQEFVQSSMPRLAQG